MPNWFPLRNGNWAVTEGDTVVRVLPSLIICIGSKEYGLVFFVPDKPGADHSVRVCVMTTHVVRLAGIIFREADKYDPTFVPQSMSQLHGISSQTVEKSIVRPNTHRWIKRLISVGVYIFERSAVGVHRQ